MRILVTGASGFIGQRLCPLLVKDHHQVWALTRGNGAVAGCTSTLVGDLSAGPVDLAAAAPEAIVHLAGESIAAGRWTAKRKARLKDSRVLGSRHLAELVALLPHAPAVVICSSATGYYGERGNDVLSEKAARGVGFLAELCEAWEAEEKKILPLGRCVSLRLGIVFGRDGGALGRMALPFRFYAGGPLGSGRQWVSWIHRDDVCGLIRFALAHPQVSGVVNATAPEQLLNRDLAKLLGKILRMPSFLPAPAFALRLALGEMADELLLSSQRVVPERATGFGYKFHYPQAEAALREALGA